MLLDGMDAERGCDVGLPSAGAAPLGTLLRNALPGSG